MNLKLMKVSFAVALVLGVTSAAGTAAPVAAQTCAGDCNGDGSVLIDEIILSVRMALGDAPIADCRATDSDRSGAVTVNELIAAITQALEGCGDPGPTNTPVPPRSTPTRTNTPTPIDEAALAASVRVATDPILRFFDLEASFVRAASVAGRSRAATGGSAGVTVCQQVACPLFGSQEVCCSIGQLSQFFSTCALEDDLGGIVVLDGLYVLQSDVADVCTGAIPVGASFTASLSNFTQEVTFPDRSFSHTFQELTETFQVAPGGCAVSQPVPFGFGVRGDGRHFIDGELQQFEGDGFGNILVDTTSEVHGFDVTVSSTREGADCVVEAVPNGVLTSSDFRVGTQFTADFTDFTVSQRRQADALLLKLGGTVGTDCLGDVSVVANEPLRLASGDTCFTAGRLLAQLGDATVSATYTASTGLDFDFGSDGSVDQHFTTCTDVPVDQCTTDLVGLCGACTGVNQCQRGLACFPCSDNCSGNTSRCGLPVTFVACEDGVF